MPIKQKLDELTSWMNWNYIGLAAGVLSVIVTVYNINKYWEEIKKTERQ
jgi:hypothetical protein